MSDDKRSTSSGIDIPVVLTRDDVSGVDDKLGQPGEYPFTRGI